MVYTVKEKESSGLLGHKKFPYENLEHVSAHSDLHVCEAIENYEISNVLSVNKWNALFGTEMMHRGCYGPVFFFRQHLNRKRNVQLLLIFN